jgi:hypothetical protein
MEPFTTETRKRDSLFIYWCVRVLGAESQALSRAFGKPSKPYHEPIFRICVCVARCHQVGALFDYLWLLSSSEPDRVSTNQKSNATAPQHYIHMSCHIWWKPNVPTGLVQLCVCFVIFLLFSLSHLHPTSVWQRQTKTKRVTILFVVNIIVTANRALKKNERNSEDNSNSIFAISAKFLIVSHVRNANSGVKYNSMVWELHWRFSSNFP